MNSMKNGGVKLYAVYKVIFGTYLIWKAQMVFYDVPLLRFLIMWCGILQYFMAYHLFTIK